MVNQMPRRTELTQSEFVMVLVVKNVHQRSQERVKILHECKSVYYVPFKGRETDVEHGEFIQDGAEFFVKRILCELDFAHVKVTDSANFEVFMDDLVHQFRRR